MAKIAGYRQPPQLSSERPLPERPLPERPLPERARITSASIHGSPAHGSRITEMRAAKSSVYGVSMNTSVATTTPGPRTRKVRRRYSIPTPAAKRIVPNHSRCETHAGTPSRWRTQ